MRFDAAAACARWWHARGGSVRAARRHGTRPSGLAAAACARMLQHRCRGIRAFGDSGSAHKNARTVAKPHSSLRSKSAGLTANRRRLYASRRVKRSRDFMSSRRFGCLANRAPGAKDTSGRAKHGHPSDDVIAPFDVFLQRGHTILSSGYLALNNEIGDGGNLNREPSDPSK